MIPVLYPGVKFLAKQIVGNFHKKSVIGWFAVLAFAILNGAVRNFLYKPFIGDLRAHQVSTVLAIIFLFLIAYVIFRKDLGRMTYPQAWRIGIAWVMFTVVFEFGAGHYLFGNSWERLFRDYNLLEGRVWVLFLASQAAALPILKYSGIRS
jgi:hypothetical protein